MVSGDRRRLQLPTSGAASSSRPPVPPPALGQPDLRRRLQITAEPPAADLISPSRRRPARGLHVADFRPAQLDPCLIRGPGRVPNLRSGEMQVDTVAAVCYAIPVLVSLLAVRVAYVLCRNGRPAARTSAAGVRCLVVLGSGGHTAEMMNIVTALQKDRYTPRFYVAALTDNMSLQKAQVYEESLIRLENDGEKIKNAQFMQIYRSREVGQSYITSIATTLLAMLHAMWLIIRIRPQVIFCNGPGTCIPLCVSAFLLKVLGLGWSSIFYIESIARVKKLSLSGLLLYKLRIADQFFVQWPQLQQIYPRAQFAGRLM